MKEKNVKNSMKNGISRLLKKQNFLAITVTDLIKESGVSRASFYRMYRSVDEVVDDVMKDVKDSLANKVIPIVAEGNEEAIKEVMREFFGKVKLKEIPIVEILPENLPFLISKLEHNAVLDRNRKYNSIEEKYGLSLYIIAVVAISRVWCYYGCQETVDEITDYTYRCLFH